MKVKNLVLITMGMMLTVASWASDTIRIYAAGRAVKDQGITFRSWGSGLIAESDDAAYEGTTSIRISTRNFFQGGMMMLSKPVDLSGAYGDANNLIMLTFKIADSSAQGGRSGGGSGDLGTPAAGAGGSQSSAPAKVEPLSMVRMIVVTDDGMRSEAYVPMTTGGKGERGWRRVGIPLKAITGFDKSSKKIKELWFSGDSTATFYIGQMEIVNDSTPIYGEPNRRELNLALGDEIEFIGNGSGGATILKYTWDFDAKDGIQIDAEGQFIKHKFRRPGDYTITLTISDVNGLKKPYSTTIKVKVNP